MGARELMGGCTILAAANQTIAANGTTAFDFGTPDNIYLPTVNSSAKQSGDRLLLVLTAVRAAGTTSTLAWVVQDADDSAGSIGTPATAITDGTSLAALGGTQQKVVGIQVQTNRPWLKVSVTHGGGGTDSYQCHATLLAIPAGL